MLLEKFTDVRNNSQFQVVITFLRRTGFVFLTLEDETGVLNVIVNPGLYNRKRK